jgi:hypothetical protein
MFAAPISSARCTIISQVPTYDAGLEISRCRLCAYVLAWRPSNVGAAQALAVSPGCGAAGLLWTRGRMGKPTLSRASVLCIYQMPAFVSTAEQRRRQAVSQHGSLQQLKFSLHDKEHIEVGMLERSSAESQSCGRGHSPTGRRCHLWNE